MDKGRLPALGKRGREMNRFKCPACGGNQYTSADTQEKKIRIATVDRCVMCGEIIPEGQQVCWKCKHEEELTGVWPFGRAD